MNRHAQQNRPITPEPPELRERQLRLPFHHPMTHLSPRYLTTTNNNHHDSPSRRSRLPFHYHTTYDSHGNNNDNSFFLLPRLTTTPFFPFIIMPSPRNLQRLLSITSQLTYPLSQSPHTTRSYVNATKDEFCQRAGSRDSRITTCLTWPMWLRLTPVVPQR